MMRKSTIRIGDRFDVSKNQSFDQTILQAEVSYILSYDSFVYAYYQQNEKKKCNMHR